MRSALFVTTSLAAVLLNFSFARADGYEPKYVGPPPFSWTGMYIGYHSGVALGSARVSDPFGPSIFGDTVRTPGSVAGAQAGANAQMGSTVFGIEADLSWADLDGTNTCFAFSPNFVSANCHMRTNYMGTLAGRLGVTVGPQGRTLLFAKAGAALASNSFNATPNFNGFLFLPSSANDGPKFGWTVGAGVEHALAGNWSVKAEYDYLAFGSTQVAPPTSVINPAAPAFFVPLVGASVSQDIHQFKVGLNYKLGADPSAVDPDWARGSLKDQPRRPAPGFEFEVGGRYVYGWGRFQKDVGFPKGPGVQPDMLVSRLTYDDMRTNAGEAFARVDTPWNLMAKGMIGGGSGKSGHMNDEDWGVGGALLFYSNTLSDPVKDKINYGTVDVGYDWLRGPNYKLASFVGYTRVVNDMAAFGCTPISAGNCLPAVPPTGSPGITEKDTWQALRLGSAAQFMILPGVRANLDAAYLAYVDFKGVDHHFFANTGVLAETFPEKGTGRGVQLEAMLSHDVTRSFSVGVGARYWALWTTDGSFNCSFGSGGLCGVTPTPAQHFRAAMEQTGVLVQATYKFGPDPGVAPIK